MEMITVVLLDKKRKERKRIETELTYELGRATLLLHEGVYYAYHQLHTKHEVLFVEAEPPLELR